MNYVYVILELHYGYTEKYEDKIVYTTLDKSEAEEKLKKLNEIKQSFDTVYKLTKLERVSS